MNAVRSLHDARSSTLRESSLPSCARRSAGAIHWLRQALLFTTFCAVVDAHIGAGRLSASYQYSNAASARLQTP